MTRISVFLALALLVAAPTTTGWAADVSATVDLVSAYVFRGVTFNNSAVLQPGLEVSGLPVTLGVWGNFDLADYEEIGLESGQFTEVDIYGSYDIPVPTEAVGVSVGYTEYTYPSGGGDADRELSLGAELGMALAPSLGIYYGVDGGIEDSLYVEASVGHDVELPGEMSLGLGATVAYSSPDEGEDGFSHYTASADLSCGMFVVGLTYIGQIDDDVLADMAEATEDTEASAGYDTELVAKIGISRDF